MVGNLLSVRLETEAFATDDVQILELTGREEISRMYELDLVVVCRNPKGLDVAEVAGAEVTLVFTRGEEEVRRIHGLIPQVVDLLETEAAHRTYRLRVAPRIFRLTFVETLDVFIGTTVPDLVKDKLDLVGLGSAFENHLAGSYPEREFIVQYKESDFAFVSRLLEHLGISYVFVQGADEERVLLIDDAGSFPSLGFDVPYEGRGDSTAIYRIEQRTTLIPHTYVVRDYNYRTPSLEIMAMRESELGYGGGFVEYGNHTKSPEEAASLARVRSEEQEARQSVYSGESSVVALTAGARFTLDGHPHIGEALLVVSVEHHFKQPGMMTAQSAEAASYHNTFTAIPALRTFRPARLTPRPTISGFTTGIIETIDGSPGTQPGIDHQGRYTVRFLFDTAAPGERRASHPVRMAQQSSGSHYGTHFPLRPGTEVILAFLAGDPDRPIIVGAVPNPETSSPVTNAEPLKSRIKSATGVLIEFSEKA